MSNKRGGAFTSATMTDILAYFDVVKAEQRVAQECVAT
jgi:hypothetical protein